MKNKKLLIIRLSALGDVAMTIPAIYSMAQRYSDWEIKVLTKPFFARLFVNCPSNISFILFEDKHRGFFGLMKLISMLHKEKFTKVADFHNILRTWVIDLSFILTGTKVAMLQKRRKERNQLLNGTPEQRRKRTEPYIGRYTDVLFSLGFYTYPVIEALPAEGNNMLPKSPFAKDGYKWVGIAPMARYMNKAYPLDRMKEVVRLLAQKDNVRIFLFGGKAEASTLKTWESISDKVKCVAGTMQIEEELALISQLDTMISMDSANMHLASLVGIPVVSIWGSTTYHCGFLGWHQSSENAVWADVPCQPCTIAGSKVCKCGDLKCMSSIAPQTICDKVLNIINK